MKYQKLRVFLTIRFSIPKSDALKKAVRSLTIAEKAVFYFFFALFTFSSLTLLYRVNASFLMEVPIQGGKLVEGVVGNPRFINPVLALSEADKNLTALIYSGLVRTTPNREMINDLAENISISSDERIYTVRIKDDAQFHDGVEVTADDVIFTIQKITDPYIKSPRRGNWEGIEVAKIDQKTMTFKLKEAYSPFIENLTIGILPKHIWNNVTSDEFAFSQFNTLPIGSGPYKVHNVERNEGGIPDYYQLNPFDDAIHGAPYIKEFVIKFYPSEEALMQAYFGGDIESMGGLSPDKAASVEERNINILSAPLPRIFAVFFNQNQSKVLLNKEVRQALDLTAPKEILVENVLAGYGTPIDGPLPPDIFSWDGRHTSEEQYQTKLSNAKDLLVRAGWKANPQTGVLEKKSKQGKLELSFSISTGNAPELRAVAEELKTAWQKLGANIEIQVFETGDLNQNVIRPRKFDALLFGAVVGRDADIYPFWHSSQRNDPGLNIAKYANARADKLLEEARKQSSMTKREESLKAFESELRNDLPAVFLYAPNYVYLAPKKVKALTLGGLSTPQDRFQGIREWYIDTDRVWKIFTESF